MASSVRILQIIGKAELGLAINATLVASSRDPGPAGGATPIADMKTLFDHPPIRFAADRQGAGARCELRRAASRTVRAMSWLPRRFCLLFVYYPCPDVAGSFLTT